MIKTNCANSTNQSKKLPQWIAALSACLAALAIGTVLGWTGNISEDMKNLSYNEIVIDDDSLGWIGSLATLGSMASCIPGAILCNVVGRKMSTLLCALPFLIGWLLIILAKWLWMIYIGRFLTGVACGVLGVTIPLYITEIAEKDIRGALTSCIDMHLSVGIVLAYAVAMILNMRLYTIIMGCLSIVYVLALVLQPESPVYYIATKKDDVNAKRALVRLRGKSYNIETEVESIKRSITENRPSKKSYISSMKEKGTKKAILISFALKFFQQAVGVLPVIFYSVSIFESAGVKIDSKVSTLIVGILPLITNVVAVAVVEKLGRRVLLITSGAGSALSLVALAIFFTLQDRDIVDEETIATIGFIPLVSLSIYLVSYTFGIGPLSIVVPAEILPPEISSVALGGASMLNFAMSFLLTKFYFNFEIAIGTDGTFYIFSAMSFLNAVFVYYFVPETKGKSVAEIQKELNN